MSDIKRVVLAYSGGLDTSVILKWLQVTYNCEVVTFTADLGQGEELAPARAKAELMGIKPEHIYVEQPKWIEKTNRHFTVTVDDDTYRRMRTEVDFWGNHPGKFYDLDHNNCVSFVGKIAEMAGLKVDYPQKLMRKPRAWLNHIAALNPQLHAKAING